MVSYQDLHDCRVHQWKKAADDWVALSRRSETAAEDIRAQGKKPLDEHWADATGKKAGKRLEDIANRLEAGGDITKGVAMVLDGLTHSMEWAQRTLHHAVELANEYGLHIQDGRAVGLFTGVGAPAAGPDVPQDVRDACTKESAHVAEVNGLIEEALRQAAQADEKAAGELVKLAKAVGVSNTSEAHNEIEVETSHVELDMLKGDIPDGKNPQLVRAWWSGLTSKQQQDLMRAVPVTLADLGGLPKGVYAELQGRDGKIDRVEMVRYALDHWDKKDDLDYGDAQGNCTNFVSSALEAGGMEEKVDDWWGLQGSNTWGRQKDATGFDWVDKRVFHSDSWARAEALQNFLLRNGSEEVSRSEARPGDIVFYEQVAPGTSTDQGETHHAAVVTAVTPDGDIKLTQHTSNLQNVSLDSRLHVADRNDGEQRIRIVRPKPDWY
ncbi:amidase domain-containing protein [Streptomyces sp. NPDC021100]|uniref:amidase domain-containing protein n=1 Tax=Streptomyces sp. NPDC021100 TaxID=3365114 RepID=UPI0037A3C70C